MTGDEAVAKLDTILTSVDVALEEAKALSAEEELALPDGSAFIVLTITLLLVQLENVLKDVVQVQLQRPLS